MKNPHRKSNALCVVCGNPFYARPNLIAKGKAKTCSRKCGAEHYKKNGKIVQCKICDKDIYVKPSDKAHNKCCCREHADMFKRVKTAEKKGMLATIKNNEIYLKCENCGMWFMQVCNKKGPVYTKTCSEKCSHANFQGENNPNYKGAVNRGKKRSYAARLSISRSKRGENNWRWQGGSKRYRGSDWRFARKEALRRDSRTCQKCGSKHNIVVHHIDPYKDSKNNRLSNLVTLCRSCHIDVHNLLIAKSKKVKACQVAR